MHAAEALRRAADPGGAGLFELASPFILRELPHHMVRGRRWGMLRGVLCNVSFLAQVVSPFCRLRGSGRVRM